MTRKKLAVLPENAPGYNKFKYKQQFGVIVICETEEHHQKVWEELTAQGYKCKAVRV